MIHFISYISDDLENEETITVSRKFNDFVVRPILKVNFSDMPVRILGRPKSGSEK